jgi:hypothetical protein
MALLPQSVVVFISYSHDSEEHRARVLALAQRLRADNISATLDRFVTGTPQAGWPRWMMDELARANFVLVVCTETYSRRFGGHEDHSKGKGADWEGGLIAQNIYDAPEESAKFVPVVFSATDVQFIPTPLRRHSHYLLEANYEALSAFLTGRAGVTPARLGGDDFVVCEQKHRATFAWSGRPAPLAHFVGRARELSALETAIMRAPAPIIIVCGVGGQGKTMLVARWLSYYERAGTHEFDHVCYFSAYRFGVEYIGFLEFAVDSLCPDRMPANASAGVLSRLLIAAMRQRRTLLVVDGLERWLEGGQAATDPGTSWNDVSRNEAESARGLGHLLHEIASVSNGSKLLLTTRAAPRALDHVAPTATIRPGLSTDGGLTGLDEREGLLLLRRLSVRGSEDEKRRCVSELDGHPLSLYILAGILRKLGASIETRESVYPHLTSSDDKLRAILQQAEALCGGDGRILQVAAISPENCPIDALIHALDPPADASEIKLTMQQLSEWGLIALAGPKRDLVQLHPLVRAHFAANIRDVQSIHERLSDYFESVPISEKARSLSRVSARIWAIEHAAAAGNYWRALHLLMDKPLTHRGAHLLQETDGLTLSAWFQTYGQSAFELEWSRKLAAGAPPQQRRVLLNSMVIAAQRCGLINIAEHLIDEALAIKEGADGA